MNECKETCEVFSRIVGYFRPIRRWNKGKAEEFKTRKEYEENKSLNTPFEHV